MQQSSGINGANLVDPALRAMFEARKRVFVDLLGWDVPVLDGTFEIDQFDTPSAAYLVLTGEKCEHRASARLLRSDGPHILRDLFPQLCTGPVPQDEAFREITRFCIDPTLPRADRRSVRNQLVSALADFAISEGISGYSAVAPVAIASFRSLSPSNRSPHSMPTWKAHLRRHPSARETSMAIGPNGSEACFAGRRSQAIWSCSR